MSRTLAVDRTATIERHALARRALFVAGYIPGVLWGLCCMGVALYFARKYGYRTESLPGLSAKLRVAFEAIPALLLIVIIVGGIISGVFTPTEASCIAVVYALVLSLAYRSVKVSQIPGFLLDASKTTGMIIFIRITSYNVCYTKLLRAT